MRKWERRAVPIFVSIHPIAVMKVFRFPSVLADLVQVICVAALFGCDTNTGVDPGRHAVDTPKWATVDAGGDFTCATTADGDGYCWGPEWATGKTMAGRGTAASPRELPGAWKWLSIKAGLHLACGITRGEETYCWYRWRDDLDATPRRVVGDPGFVSITVGGLHACGLTAAGAGFCWGDNKAGQLGTSSQASPETPVPIAGGLRFLALSAGTESTCGLVAPGDVYCWGDLPTTGLDPAPRLVQAGFSFTQIDVGGIGGRTSVCAAAGNDSAVFCFGYDSRYAAEQPQPTRVPVPSGTRAAQVAVGGVRASDVDLPQDQPYGYLAHACVVEGLGTVSCWGIGTGHNNTYGQLGDGTTTDRDVPVRASSLAEVVQVTAGGAHTCALTMDGSIYCWGANYHGQLGIGETGGFQPLARRIEAPVPLR
jgi:alpha-tubulin suppressor-like RCC1 family protein